MESVQDALSGLKVLDLGTGMSAALVTKFLAEAGATVNRLEPEGGDPFYGVHPAYRTWHGAKTVEKVPGLAAPRVTALLAEADICVLGGEDFPGLDWRLDAESLAARHPRLVLLDITGYPPSFGGTSGKAAEILVQARSGLCFEHYTDRPFLFGFAAAAAGAALQGIVALLGALYARERGAGGQIAATSLWEGALTWGLTFWYKAENPDPAFDFVMPKDPHPLIFRCADGKYIHFVLGSFGSKGRLYRILKIDDPAVGPDDSGMPTPKAGPKNFFGPVDTLAEYVAKFTSEELMAAIRAAEVAVEPVLPPGACWDDPQVRHNGILRRSADGVRYVGIPFAADWIPAPPAAGKSGDGSPLGGVRVLDFGALVAGPYGMQPLADLGAEVIKVEPLTGEVARNVPRSYLAGNRGKKSIAVNMKSPEGSAIVARLCASADIIENNFRPGVSARLGLDPAALHRTKPEMIVVETTGYGSSGPSGDRPGYDMVFQALCGFEELAGGEGNPPLWNRSTMVDYAGGLVGTVATLLALVRGARQGGGASLRPCLFNAALFLLSELIESPEKGFIGARRLNSTQTGFHPAESLYQAQDGWIAVYAPTGQGARSLTAALGLDPSAFPPRADWGQAQADTLAAALRGRTRAEAMEALQRHEVWAEPVLEDGNRWLEEKALQESGTIVRWRDPRYGEVRQLGPMFRLSRGSGAAGHASPAVGAHTRAILAELGFTPAEIEDLYGRKIVA